MILKLLCFLDGSFFLETQPCANIINHVYAHHNKLRIAFLDDLRLLT